MGAPMDTFAWSKVKEMSTSLHFPMEFIPRKPKEHKRVSIRVWRKGLLQERSRNNDNHFPCIWSTSCNYCNKIYQKHLNYHKIFDAWCYVIVITMPCKSLLETSKKWIERSILCVSSIPKIYWIQDTRILICRFMQFFVTSNHFFILFTWCHLNVVSEFHGEITPCQVEHHVRTKLATPILYAIDNFKNYDFFSTYT